MSGLNSLALARIMLNNTSKEYSLTYVYSRYAITFAKPDLFDFEKKASPYSGDGSFGKI